MAAPFRLTPEALDDLDTIWNFIAADSFEVADEVESAIFAACRRLVLNPRLGTKRVEITPLPVRFWVVTQFPNFVIVYRPGTEPLQIVAILHGKRNLKRVLKRRKRV